MANTGEVWKFIAHCGHAEQVYLVKDRIGGQSVWLPMQRGGGRQWELEEYLDPGYYRFRYFAVEGRTFFNCGSSDLTAVRVRGADPAVRVEPLTPVSVANSA